MEENISSMSFFFCVSVAFLYGGIEKTGIKWICEDTKHIDGVTLKKNFAATYSVDFVDLKSEKSFSSFSRLSERTSSSSSSSFRLFGIGDDFVFKSFKLLLLLIIWSSSSSSASSSSEKSNVYLGRSAVVRVKRKEKNQIMKTIRSD